MGYNTQIQIGNDMWHEIKDMIRDKPEKFISMIEEGMNKGHGDGQTSSEFGNYIRVTPSHHADQFMLLMAWRNSFEMLDEFAVEAKAKTGYYNNSGAFRVKLELDEMRMAKQILTRAIKRLKELAPAPKESHESE